MLCVLLSGVQQLHMFLDELEGFRWLFGDSSLFSFCFVV